MSQTPAKQVTLGDFLTDEEISKAIKLYESLHGTGQFVKAIHDQIIGPNMERINKSLEQENNAMYLAYAVEYIMSQANPVRRKNGI